MEIFLVEAEVFHAYGRTGQRDSYDKAYRLLLILQKRLIKLVVCSCATILILFAMKRNTALRFQCKSHNHEKFEHSKCNRKNFVWRKC